MPSPASAITTPSSNYAAYVLAELKCATLRARLIALEIQSAGVALSGSIIDADTALEWVRDAGALGLIAISSRWLSS